MASVVCSGQERTTLRSRMSVLNGPMAPTIEWQAQRRTSNRAAQNTVESLHRKYRSRNSPAADDYPTDSSQTVWFTPFSRRSSASQCQLLAHRPLASVASATSSFPESGSLALRLGGLVNARSQKYARRNCRDTQSPKHTGGSWGNSPHSPPLQHAQPSHSTSAAEDFPELCQKYLSLRLT